MALGGVHLGRYLRVVLSQCVTEVQSISSLIISVLLGCVQAEEQPVVGQVAVCQRRYCYRFDVLLRGDSGLREHGVSAVWLSVSIMQRYCDEWSVQRDCKLGLGSWFPMNLNQFLFPEVIRVSVLSVFG